MRDYYIMAIRNSVRKGYLSSVFPMKAHMKRESDYYQGPETTLYPLTMVIVYSTDASHSRDQKELYARTKRENAERVAKGVEGVKMKCNGSHSTATDRSLFKRIPSWVTRNIETR